MTNEFGSFPHFFSLVHSHKHTHTHLFLFDEFVVHLCVFECECRTASIQSHNIHSHFGLYYRRHVSLSLSLPLSFPFSESNNSIELCDYFVYYIVFHIPLHFTFLTRIDSCECVCVCALSSMYVLAVWHAHVYTP